MEDFKTTYLEWNELLNKGVISKDELLELIKGNDYYNQLYNSAEDINLDILFELIEEQIYQDCLYFSMEVS